MLRDRAVLELYRSRRRCGMARLRHEMECRVQSAECGAVRAVQKQPKAPGTSPVLARSRRLVLLGLGKVTKVLPVTLETTPETSRFSPRQDWQVRRQ